MSISPVSSMASSPRVTSLPIIDSAGHDQDLADHLDDEYDNDYDYNYDNNDNNNDDYDNYDDDDDTNDDTDDQFFDQPSEQPPQETPQEPSTAELIVPAEPSKTPESLGSQLIPVFSETTIEVRHMPEKGVGAWLNYLNAKQKRRNVWDTLRSVIF